MRIISQDGTIDVPYEQAIVEYEACERNGEDVFYIIFARTEKSYFSIARYSTESKAQKAMEMLRKKYKDYAKATNKSNFFTMFDYPKVFQFPQDEDVEV